MRHRYFCTLSAAKVFVASHASKTQCAMPLTRKFSALSHRVQRGSQRAGVVVAVPRHV